jgi:hypothetical protein
MQFKQLVLCPGPRHAASTTHTRCVSARSINNAYALRLRSARTAKAFPFYFPVAVRENKKGNASWMVHFRRTQQQQRIRAASRHAAATTHTRCVCALRVRCVCALRVTIPPLPLHSHFPTTGVNPLYDFRYNAI